MSKNIYDSLNDIDFKHEDYQIEDISEMEKIRMKKNFKDTRKKKQNTRKWMSGAAALIVLAGAARSGMGQEVYARGQSRLNQVSYSISQAIGIERELDQYAQILDKIVEVDGYELKLNEFILEKDQLVLSTSFYAGEDLEDINLNDELFINGRRVGINSVSGSMERLDGGVIRSISQMNIDELDLDGDLEVDYRVRSIDTRKDGKKKRLKGPWDFSFQSNLDQLEAANSHYPIDASLEIAGQELILEKMQVNDLEAKIYASRKDGFDYDLLINARSDQGEVLDFQLFTVDGDKMIFKYHGELDPRDLDFLDLDFYYMEYPKKSGRIVEDYKDSGESLHLELNN